MKNQITITIDGGSGVGKGTITKHLAQELNFTSIDSGAMYRTVAYILQQNNINKEQIINNDIEHINFFYSDSKLCVNTCSLNNQVVEELPIRTQENSKNASNYASIPIVRKHITNQIRQIMAQGGVILEGRDAGSIIYPQAELKFFVECPIDIRAKRRLQDYKEKGILYTQEEVEKELEERDHQDMTRDTDPLRIPNNAYIITNDDSRSIQDLVSLMREIVENYDTLHQ